MSFWAFVFPSTMHIRRLHPSIFGLAIQNIVGDPTGDPDYAGLEALLRV